MTTCAYCGTCGDPTNLEFQVESRTFKTFAEAAVHAIGRALTRGESSDVDVLCWTRAAAHAFGCLEDYDSDPEASVTKRVTIKATDLGQVR